MKTIDFNSIFECYRHETFTLWTCTNISKLKGNLIGVESADSFQIKQKINTYKVYNYFEAAYLNEVYIYSRGFARDCVEVTADFYLLNTPIKTLHPSYQVLLDEILQTQKVEYILSFRYNEEFYLSINVERYSPCPYLTLPGPAKFPEHYWLAGEAFKFKVDLDNFKFIDLE